MKTFDTLSAMAQWAEETRAAGRTIGLVPTLGALHIGQDALLRAAREKADDAVVSIFVNPLQFGPNEPFARFPRRLAEDAARCEAGGAAAVFTPSLEEMLPSGTSTYVTEETVSKPLCGPSRPTHFRGVATVTAKLFNIVRPHFVFFGEKHAQRAAVVRKMAADLHFGVEIVVVPTAREPDGLAASVRNAELTAAQRQDALAISRALKRAKELADSGVRSTDRIIAEATHILGQSWRVRVIYVALVDPRTMETVREVTPGNTRMTIVAWVDEVRLIDSALL